MITNSRTPITSNDVVRATISEVNAAANHPSIKPWLTTHDWTHVITRPDVIALTCGSGCMVFEETSPGCLHAHYLLYPGNPRNLDMARAMISYIIENGALGVYGAISMQNDAANRFTRKLPARLVASTGYGKNVYGIRRDEWPWLTNQEQNPN